MTKKVCIITGGTRGIGFASVKAFLKEGYQVVFYGSKEETVTNALKNLNYDNVEGRWINLNDEKLVNEDFTQIKEKYGTIDVLINNAGLVIGLDKEHEGSLDEWDVVIDTNIKGLLAMTRMVVPGMVERQCGHIINIGSVAGDAAYAGGSVYCATKAAVKALSDGLRIDLVDTPLRVTNIKPGLVETNFSVVRFRGDKSKADAVYKGIRPLTGDDIAEVVYYAASAPAHVQIAEVLVMPTYQANGTVCHRNV